MTDDYNPWALVPSTPEPEKKKTDPFRVLKRRKVKLEPSHKARARIRLNHMPDTEVIPIRLPKDLAKKYRAMADSDGIPFSTFLRLLLTTHPKAKEKKK